MITTFRTHGKVIMAILGSFLMIAFIVPSSMKRPGIDRNEVVGHIGDTRFTAAEFNQFDQEWYHLTHDLAMFPLGNGKVVTYVDQRIYPYLIPLARRQMAQNPQLLFQSMQNQNLIPMMAVGLATEIRSQLDATSFALLVLEARKMGAYVTEDAVNEEIKQLAQVPTQNIELRRAAVRDFLTLLSGFQQISSSIKITPAEAVGLTARRDEKISLQLVNFSADDYLGQTTDPTPEQLREFFTEYKNIPAGAGKYGFGYKVPDRLRVQYLKVPSDAMRNTITIEEIYKEYKSNPSRYQSVPKTQPSTTQSATSQPTTRAQLADTRPTTRPFDEVKDVIRADLANRRADELARYILNLMSTDWAAYREAVREANGATPTNPPATSVGQPFNSYQYLTALAQRVQNSKEGRGVLVTTLDFPTLATPKDLADQLEALGKSFVRGQGMQSFVDYLSTHVDAFLNDQQRKQMTASGSSALALFQPSPILIDNKSDRFIFRISGVDPNHPPQLMDEYTNQVRKDWKTLQAYNIARRSAEKFLQQANTLGGLQQALNASASTRPATQAATTAPTTRSLAGIPATQPIVTDLFNPGQPPENVKLPPPAASQLSADTFKLLSERLRTGTAHPRGLFEIPSAHTVVVAQLEDAQPATEYPFFAVSTVQSQLELERFQQSDMLLRWLDPQHIVTRMNYKPEKAQANRSNLPPGQPAPQPAPPINPF